MWKQMVCLHYSCVSNYCKHPENRLCLCNGGIIAVETGLLRDWLGSRVRDYPEIFFLGKNGCRSHLARPARCLALRHSNWQVSLSVNSPIFPFVFHGLSVSTCLSISLLHHRGTHWLTTAVSSRRLGGERAAMRQIVHACRGGRAMWV